MLDRQNQSLKDIVQTLQQYYEHAGGDSPTAEATMSQKEILQGLISALDSVS